ncbi:MAG: aryl-sulfate sulfotransferase [Brevinema sp.]
MALLLLVQLFSLSVLFAQAPDITLKVNPNKLTPLSALVYFSKTNTESVTIIVQGKDKLSSIGVVYPPNYGMQFPIHGLYMDYTNTILIRYGSASVKPFRVVTPKISFTTKPLPTESGDRADRPFTISTEVKTDLLEPTRIFNQDLYFSTFPNAYYMIGFDRKGEIRYLYQNTQEYLSMMRMEQDGTNIYMIYTSDNKFYLKRDLLGNLIYKKRYHVHHESTPYREGRELILGNSQWGWEDRIYELNTEKNLVSCKPIGDLFRKVIDPKDQVLLDRLVYDHYNIYMSNQEPQRVDWAHGNSLVYDSKQDLLYISLRHLGVIAVNYQKWELIWFLAEDSLKISTGIKYGQKPKESLYLVDIPSLQKYRLKTTSSPKGQHALFIKNNGNLLLFDNRSQGLKNPAGSQVREYQINQKTMTANLIRSFVDQDRSYSHYVGDVDLSGNDHENWLIFYGHSYPKRIIELAPDNTVLYHLMIDSASLMYRIDKFPLYPYRDQAKKYSLDYIQQ